MTTKLIVALAAVCAVPTALAAQTSGSIDFETEVLPLFRQHCISCHGPDQQMGGYRLDRRSVALRDDFGPITPTESASSRLYLRLTGSAFGAPMPPSGPLAAEEIGIIRDWIDAGAPWPDHLANERDLPPPDPTAVALTEALRRGEWSDFLGRVRANPDLLNARATGGSTPFMYAVLYGDAALVEALLELGADVNVPNDGNVTPLIWGATSLEKARLLIDAGADVNARSDDGRTALFNAATRHGGAPVVRLLIEHGAEVNPPNRGPADSTPLLEATRAADPEIVRLLLDEGADASADGGAALGTAYVTGCEECADLLIQEDLSPVAYTRALFMTIPDGDVDTARFLLDRGAIVDGRDPFGRTPLMYAAASDLLPLDTVQLLIERGADVNAVSDRDSERPLSIARLRGQTPIVEALTAAGATASAAPSPAHRSGPSPTPGEAVRRSIPLLQKADQGFTSRTGCVSCHNNSLPAMAISRARSTGFEIDEAVARAQVGENVRILAGVREKFRQGISFADLADPAIFGYILVGLHAEGYEADESTDTVAMMIRKRQLPDGRWAGSTTTVRPPLSNGSIGMTALALRSLHLYAPPADRDEYRDAVARAAGWLARAGSRTNGDRAWRLLGLAWANQDTAAIEDARSELLRAQRDDGGWGEIDTLPSGAFETGQSLVALREAGLPASHPAWQRGIRFLLDTQTDDGSWFVQTRALGFQPYFDNGFPHGLSQWISGAATSWATMALSVAAEEMEGDE